MNYEYGWRDTFDLWSKIGQMNACLLHLLHTFALIAKMVWKDVYFLLLYVKMSCFVWLKKVGHPLIVVNDPIFVCTKRMREKERVRVIYCTYFSNWFYGFMVHYWFYYAPRKISGEHIVAALSVRPSVRQSVSPSVRPIRVRPITLLFEVGF